MTYAGVAECARRVRAGETTAAALVDETLARIEQHDGALGAYLAIDADGARAQARELDARADKGLLAGATIALKDVIVTRGLATTAASKILAGWIPPYDAHVVEKLRAAGAIVVGKANCDEFAMGSSTEHSAMHPTKNPWDPARVPGGSSGGSAAAVAAGLCAASLGTDTGGSIRQPAAFCGVVGLKPTYGRVSRWGAIAFASSLDQIGPIARTVEDAALLLGAIAGLDPRDATSLDAPVPDFAAAAARGASEDLAGLRVGIPAEYFGAMDDDVRAAMERTVSALLERGCEPVELSLPSTEHALHAYYVVAPAEAASNLARYDGVRFGMRAAAADLAEMFAKTRGAGFGPEVKRRIMLGTYVLRSGSYDAYYKKAQQVRTLVKRDFDRAWRYCDVILTPTTPTPAFAFGACASPLEMYASDIYTLPCNLAGLPGLSVPVGLSAGGLPVGAQLLGKPLDEETVIRVGAAIEAAIGLRERPKGFA
ncbi:MAG TPA: Asp-tRNA(Asn)/Glu-tRNA(Gln) amidotransferase subunit GatA [Kofleriaceae bacterium]